MIWYQCIAFALCMVLTNINPGSAADQTVQASRREAIRNQETNGMVLIPGGSFRMGKDVKNDTVDHAPAHQVELDAFLMDKHEVTNADYLAFCKATGHPLPFFWGMKEFHSGPEFTNHPVVGISSTDATAYAKWAKKRLPTEAEWEYASRGGLLNKNFPNGDDLSTSDANFKTKGHTWQDSGGSQPVGSFSPNAFGLYDMAGNVGEWVQDYYHGGTYKDSPLENPSGPKKGTNRVVRGGGWYAGKWCNRVYPRFSLPASWVDFNIGFRCVKDIHKNSQP